MQYAVELLFNKEAENEFFGLFETVASAGVNPYMLKNDIAPHLTLCMFRTDDDEEQLAAALKILAENLPCFSLGFSSIGQFLPGVIFALPMPTEQLLQAGELANACFAPFGEAFLRFYVKNNWTPHVSLGVKLTADELTAAFTALLDVFRPMAAFAERVALVESETQRIIEEMPLRRANAL